jgi:hypothetical protein
MDGIAHSLEVYYGARDNKELITVFFTPGRGARSLLLSADGGNYAPAGFIENTHVHGIGEIPDSRFLPFKCIFYGIDEGADHDVLFSGGCDYILHFTLHRGVIDLSGHPAGLR